MQVKLNLSSTFYGRKEEIVTLLDAYKCSRQEALPSVVFLEGAAGIGKSCLVEEFLKRTSLESGSSSGVFIGRGKFQEDTLSTQLLAPILHAVEEIIQFMLRSTDKESWIKRIREVLHGEYHFFKSVLPMDDFFGIDGKSSENTCPEAVLESANGDDNGKVSFERLCLVFRNLLQEVSSHVSVILVLDDLQWAGRDALALMRTILLDGTKRKFLFLGLHRPDVGDNGTQRCSYPLLTSFKRQVCGNQIRLNNFTKGDIASFLCKVLSPREEPDVTPLADSIIHKTGGNAFFVKEFLLSLERRGFLWYSIKKYKWRWDLSRIRVGTEVSSNVVELVSSKINTGTYSYVLAMAALLGSTFIDVDNLLCVVSINGLSKDDLVGQLEKARTDGLLEELSHSFEERYKFSHDNIHESALSLLPGGSELVEIHLRAGRMLRRRLSVLDDEGSSSANGINRLLFQTVTQMNKGTSFITDKNESKDLAELNYRAAKVAMGQLSFFPAADFLRKTTDLLGTDPWKDANSLDLMMEASVKLSRMEYCCGRLDESVRVANDVLLHARSFEDKHLVIHTKVFCLMQQQKKKEAIKTVISTLSELDIKYPRKFIKLHLVGQLLKVKKLMAKMSDDDLLNLPWTNDQRVTFASEFLLRLGEVFMSFGMEEHLMLAMLIGVELTLKEGRFGRTAMTFQAWGFILASEGSLDEAYRFGKLGSQMAAERRGGVLDDRTMLLFYLWIYHWKLPYREGIKPSSRALEKLWEGGAIENVLLDTNTYLRIYFCSGLNLDPLLRDIKRYSQLCSDYQQEVMLGINLPFFQMVSNLMGKSNNTTELTGEFMKQDEYIKTWKKTNKAALQMLYFHRMMLGFFFNDYKLAGRMSDKITQMQLEGPEVWVPYRYFFKGLTALSLAKEAGWRRYSRQGRAIIKQLEAWVEKGVVNCLHLLLILRAARLSAINAEQDLVQQAFDAAISATARTGVLHDRAIANELAGLYFVGIENCHALALTYMLRARNCYQEWGANGKVQHMEVQFKQIFSQSSHSSCSEEGKGSRVFLAKARLSRLSSKNLKDIKFNSSLLECRRQSDYVLSSDESF